jgi:hypothetical protein
VGIQIEVPKRLIFRNRGRVLFNTTQKQWKHCISFVDFVLNGKDIKKNSKRIRE